MFEKGDVLHWWHEHNSAGIRTYFSDDYLWLPYVLSEYISKTKDYSVLEEKTKYLEDKLMGNRRELYDVYHNINVEDSVFNHAKKQLHMAYQERILQMDYLILEMVIGMMALAIYVVNQYGLHFL